jgi:hypothetical protein
MATREDRWKLHVPEEWRQVAACVDRYEDSASEGLPNLSEVLSGVEPSSRLQALVEIVQLDMEYRRKRGQRKSSEEYIAEFPELRGHAVLSDVSCADEPRSGAAEPKIEPVGKDRWPSPRGALDSTLAVRSDDTDKDPVTGGACVDGRISAATTALGAGADAIPYFAAIGASTVPPAEAPSRIGQFVIRETLGRGGFGTVYRAYDPALERDVAIKVASESLSQALDSTAAFQHEARSTATLRHPNIVTVLASGETDDRRPYIVYEFVPGNTLAVRIEKRDYSLAQGVAWVADVADALDEAHRSRIIHRDVKPANILIDERGMPRLTDFGMAKRDDRFFLNERGRILGTASYMSPEQAAGRSDWASPAADIYSLGIVLYEVLCGRRPFCSDRCDDLLEQVKRRPPDPPRTVNANIPSGMEEICLRALSKDPTARFRTAHDMAKSLRAAIRPRNTRLWSAGIAASLLIVAIASWLLFGGGASLPALEITKLGVYRVPAGETREVRLPDEGPPEAGDALSVHGELTREAYVYWIAFQDHERPKLLWPSEEELEHPRRQRSFDSADSGPPAITVPTGTGVTLLVCGASDRPLSRTDLDAVLAMRPELPPAIWDGKLHTAIKPPHQERPDEDIRGGGLRLERARPFKVPQPLKELAEAKFNAYYAIMFSHFDPGAPIGHAKPPR